MPEPIQNLPKEVDLLHPDGSLYTVPSESVPQAIQAGYTFPTQGQLIEAQNEAQYGSRPFSAAGLGAASTVPFALHALTKSGVTTPEAAKEIMGRNPVSTTVGEVGGIGAQALLAPEVSAIGRIGQAGRGVEAVASKVLGQGLAKVAGSATEGALYGLNNVINEHALGDPNLTGESAMAQIGASAFWGGTAGALLHGAEQAVPPVVDSAKQAIGKSMENLGLSSTIDALKSTAKEGYATISSLVSGVPKEDILAAIQNRGTSGIPLEAESVASGLNDQYKAIERARRVASNDIRPMETQKVMGAVVPEAVQAEYGKIYNRVGETISEIRDNPDLYPARYAQKLEQIQSSLKDVTSDSTPPEMFNALDELKGKIDKQIKYGKFPTPADEDAQTLIKGLRQEVKESLENPDVFGKAATRQAAYNEAVSDHLGVEKEFQKAFMRKAVTKGGEATYVMDPVKVENFLKYSQTPKGQMRADVLSRYTDSSNNLLNQIEETYKSLPDQEFNKDAVKSVIEKNNAVLEQQRQQGLLNNLARGAQASGEGGLLEGGAGAIAAHAAGVPLPIIGAGVATYEAFRYPGQAIQRLARLEETLNKTAQTIIKGAKALSGPADRVATYLRGYAGAKAAVMSTKDFQKIANGIKHLIANPELLVDKFHQNTEGISPHAPDTANAITQAGGRAVSFLASKLPPTPQAGPLAPETKPSKADLSTFSKYYDAVENPLVVLKEAVNGTLTREGVEAIGTVYPTLFNKMKGEIAAQLSNVKEPIPYHRRMMLTLLLGKDVDGSMNPQMIVDNQKYLSISNAQTQQQDAALVGNPKVRAKGLDNLSASEQTLTSMQATAQRERK